MGESDPDKFIPHPTDQGGHGFPCINGSICGEEAHCPPQQDGDITPLREMAISTHQMYEEFLAVGFSDSQALYCATAVVCGGPKCP